MLSCGARADDKDPAVVVVQAGPPYSVGLPAKDYYSDNDVLGKYEAAVAKVFENLSPDHDGENATLHTHWISSRGSISVKEKSKDCAHDVVEFEKKLAAAFPDAEDRDDVTVSDCIEAVATTKLTPAVILQSYVPQRRRQACTPDPSAAIINGLAPSGVKTSRLIVVSPSYLKALSKA